jgi:hypothetical protein
MPDLIFNAITVLLCAPMLLRIILLMASDKFLQVSYTRSLLIIHHPTRVSKTIHGGELATQNPVLLTNTNNYRPIMIMFYYKANSTTEGQIQTGRNIQTPHNFLSRQVKCRAGRGRMQHKGRHNFSHPRLDTSESKRIIFRCKIKHLHSRYRREALKLLITTTREKSLQENISTRLETSPSLRHTYNTLIEPKTNLRLKELGQKNPRNTTKKLTPPQLPHRNHLQRQQLAQPPGTSASSLGRCSPCSHKLKLLVCPRTHQLPSTKPSLPSATFPGNPNVFKSRRALFPSHHVPPRDEFSEFSVHQAEWESGSSQGRD